MRVQAALLARYAEVDPASGLLNVQGGGVDVFGLRELPAQFTMAIAVILRYAEQEAGREVSLSFFVRDPDLAVVGEPATFPITPRLGEYHSPGWEGVFVVTGGIDLSIERVGAHSVAVQIDGVEAGDIAFQVVLAA